MAVSVLVAALLVQASSSAVAGVSPAAGDWTLFSSHDGYDIFVDAASPRVEGDVVRFRLRHVTRPGAGSFHTAILRLQMDCAAQTLAFESATAFDAAGATLTSEDVPEGRLDKDPVYKDSDEARLYARLCPAALRRPLAVRPPPSPMPMITTVAPTPVAPPMIIAPPAPPPPPPPPPRGANDAAVPARPAVPLVTLFTADDYPAAALRLEEQGTVRYRLTVGRDGRVTACAITGSSGSASLDSVTCRLVSARARFTAARNAKGRRVEDTVHGRIVWRIPEDEPDPTSPLPPISPPPAQ